MARDSGAPVQELQISLFHACMLAIVVVLVAAADSSETKNLPRNFDETLNYCNRSTSNWYRCPQGWTLFMSRCFRVTEATLTWTQAQALCRSYGGNLAKITSQCEQVWVSHFVTEQLKRVSLDGNQSNISSVSHIPSIDSWIGFVWLINKTFQWSDGQAGVEQDGFWAVDGFNSLEDKPASKLCCDIKAHPPFNNDLRWHLASCDELHSSVCELSPCEEHTQRCEDGNKCVNKAWLCDGHWDCQDGSDEKDCLSTTSTPASSHCGTVFKEQSGSFVSPNFPEGYPPFLNCLWRIEAMSPEVIRLLVTSLDTEEEYDTLNIYEGIEVSAQQLIVSMGGKMSNQTVKSQGSFITVHFISDYSVQGKGFNISWTAGLETQQCGGQLVAGDQESILSFPQLEEDTSTWSSLKVFNCEWLISSLSRTSLLSLQFKNITLVRADSVTVYDGGGTDTPVITHITSAASALTPSSQQDFVEAVHTYSVNIPPVITSSGQHLLLHVIISKGSFSSFVIAYKSGCDTFISSSSSLILSPGYPKTQYPNDLNCTWIVPSDNLGRHLSLFFLPCFSTESGKDYVQVFNSESKQLVTNVTTMSGHVDNVLPGISSFHGFVINFVTDLTVNNGYWAVAVSYDCVVLSVIPPLLLNSTDAQFGAVVGYSCLKGFQLDGPSYAECGWGGQWLPSDLPACTNINCGPIPKPSGAYLVNATGQNYGSHAQYKCLNGHILVSGSESTCGENGWENIPTCKLITCPKEHPPNGGNAKAEDIKVGYLREFFCKPNLQLVGSKFSHCNMSGQWTEGVPVCEDQKCSNLYGLLHSQRNVTESVAVGSSIHVICDEGYKLFGQDVLMCMNSLHFDYPLPSCIDVDECDNSSKICGIHLCQNYIGGFSCFCQAGYKHLDNSSHVCNDINECEASNAGCSHICVNMPGNYKCGCPQNMSLYEGPFDQISTIQLTPNKTCIASCKPFVAAEGMIVVYQQKSLSNGDFLNGTKAAIFCPHGSFPIGASVVLCVAGEGWTPPAVNCTELLCDAPRTINEGTVSYTNLTLGSSVTYSCNKNFRQIGPRIRFCEKELNSEFQLVKLSWTGSQPICVSVTCPVPQSPVHGNVYFSSTAVHSIAVVRCECGYWLVGQSVAKCMSDGTWSHPSPLCEVQFCLHPGLPAQAKMLEYTPGFPVGSTVRFQCLNKGYQLSSENSIKCLAYKQTKVSAVKPSIDLTINGLFVSNNKINVTTTCNFSYQAEELIDQWQKLLSQLCHILNVEVGVQNDTTGTLDETTLNITIHFILSSDNASTTCSCRQDIQKYLMTPSNHITLNNLERSCPVITLRPKSLLTIKDHWFCGSGLRLQDSAQQCGQEALPSCMEDCIDEGIETLDEIVSTNATMEEEYDSGSESAFRIQSSSVTMRATLTAGTLPQGTEQTTQHLVSSISSSSHNQSLDKATIHLSSPTTTTVEPASKIRKRQTTPHFDVSKQTSTNMWATESKSSTPQTSSSFKFSSTVNESTAKTMDKSMQNTKQSSQQSSTSFVLTSHNPTDDLNNTTSKFPSSTSPMTKSIARTSTTTSSQVVFNSQQTSPAIMTPAESSTIQQTGTLVRLSTSTATTSLTAGLTPPSQSPTNSTSKLSTLSTRTLSLTNTQQRTLSSTHQTSPTKATIKTTITPASNSKATEQSVSPSRYTTPLHGTSQLKTAASSTTRSYLINDQTFPWSKYQTSELTSAATSYQEETNTKYTGTSISLVLAPVYSVEIYDEMSGSFTNISCIDAVHVNINAKVNELLNDFEEKMGKLVCMDALDASLKLNSGNIRFKGTRAKILIKYSIISTASSKESMTSCGMEFKNLAASQLPKMFDEVDSHLSASQCKFLNYTGKDLNFTYNGWRCQEGYMLDENLFQCFSTSLMRTSTADSSTITMTLSPPAAVLTVPRLSMKFVGTFSSSSQEDKIGENCIMGYKKALSKVLTALEPNLQSMTFKDIYVAVGKDIHVTIKDKKVIAEVTVSLLPLESSVDLLSMQKCANFTSLQFHEPSQQTPLVSVTGADLSLCPVIVLSAQRFRTDLTKIEFDCIAGYLLNLANFKCINEFLPFYLIRINMAVATEHEELVCEDSIETSTQSLIEDVYAEIRQDISKGNICNNSENILLLQEQINLLKEKQATNTSISVMVGNFNGSQTETLDCAQQLDKYLKSIISTATTAMIESLPQVCQVGMTVPQNNTAAYKQWVCIKPRAYNSLTHQCTVGIAQAPGIDTSGQSLSGRQKRSVTQLYLRPQWNETIPSCIDIEPPTFHPALEGPQIISIGQHGSFPVSISLPNVTDNSGMIPSVKITPDVSLPYIFIQDTTVVMTAKDNAGNIATYIINVTVTDEFSPVINCPTNPVFIVMETCQDNLTITYNNAEVNASDNSGAVSVVYDPPEGSVLNVSGVIFVTASAVDDSLNVASCSFIARVENCPEWSLPVPVGGNKSCVQTGANNQDWFCVVSCPADKGFAVQPPNHYIFNGHWLPHNRVPQCVVSRFPDYEVHLKFHSSYHGNTTGDCLDEILNALVKSVRHIIMSTCWNATQELNFTQIDSVGAFHKDSSMMTAKLRILIQLTVYSEAATLTAHWCGEAILQQLDLNGTLQGSCGQLILNAPVASAGKNACPKGFAHLNGMCYECPAGSYLSNPKCEDCPRENTSESINCSGLDCPRGQYSTEPKCLECPIGTYQNSSGSSECVACMPGFSTSDVGTIDENECHAECNVNHLSFTGVKPCIRCPLGTHQPKPGSKHCDVCEFDSDGQTQFSYCQKPCPPGEYSSNGTSPCSQCPRNYFSESNGSRICTECPGNNVTMTEGSLSQSQCQAYDPCLNNTCKHGSQCQPHGRYFKCECLPGFAGLTCQDKVEICDSQACENNSRCERNGNITICSCLQDLGETPCPQEIAVVDHCQFNPCIYGYCVITSEKFKCFCYNGYHGERCEMKVDNCANVTCHNGGVCVDLVVGFQCSCTEKFTGVHCDSKISHCQVNHCLNGGACVDGPDSFNCSCLDGFTGDLCEVDIDECRNSPCFNGGFCQDDINSFRCLCLLGYHGNFCESVVNPCDIQSCLNGAICSRTNNLHLDFTCTCKEGFTGGRCEVDIDVCDPMPCSMNGSYSCEKDALHFKCNCLPGWEGNLCDEKVDPCSTYPCDNGGLCSRSNDSFTCTCPPSFTSPTCSVSLFSCWSQPCQNLGSCVDTTAGFLCQCPPGFTGSLCEQNIDECGSRPCLNQSVCQDGVNTFTCSCSRGHAGDLCEVNIDECVRQPCQHNSSCTPLDGDYMCNCSAGFTGKHCGIKIDECSSSPCQHQGTCVGQVASFHCICPQGYYGGVCEEVIDKCQNTTTCLNNGTCQNINNKSVCHCNPHFTGDDCGKEKTANFDLYFIGGQSLYSQPLIIHTGNLSEFSLCLWMKFSSGRTNGTYLVLKSGDGLNPYLTLRGSQAISSLFASKEISLYVNDGHWHHFCLVLSSVHWTIFKDGINFQTGDMGKLLFGNSLILKLGEPLDKTNKDEWFKGHLHDLNMYSFVLAKETILNMSQNCHFQKPGDLFDWVAAEPHMFTDVQVSMPSQCGQALCSTGNENRSCTSVDDKDKTPPESVSCPGTVVVTSEKKWVSVSWTDPEFSDDVGIVSIKQNFRSGQIFPHGQYLVTYIAYDAEQNSANCSFSIFVRKLACVDPPPPTNGARICAGWEHGRYCIPSCMKNFNFVTPIPIFYRCGYEGIWDPSDEDEFVFPMCARALLPSYKMFGSISFIGPKCSSSNKLRLKEKLIHVLTEFGHFLNICLPNGVCNYTLDFSIQCAATTQRSRRATSNDRSTYAVGMNISIPSSVSDKLSNPDTLPDNVTSLMKQDKAESDFLLASVDLHQTSHCQTGQILINADKPQCLNCPAGYYQETESVCSPCPRGWYNDKSQQVVCVQCADGLITSGRGSTSSSQCSTVCNAGTYFNVSTSTCEPCLVGEYQNRIGQWSCISCPMGLTTQLGGAVSGDECQDLCGAGQELGVDGICVDCPVGTYSAGKIDSLFCTPCPVGWSTEKKKAVNETQCSLKKCEKGYYHDLENKVCLPCPRGTFQEHLGAASCEPCGVRLTTEQEGAASRSLCISGQVNECDLKIVSCTSGSKCVDLDDGYRCEYLCDSYCSTLKFCDDGDSIQDKECHCTVDLCKNYNSTYKSLVIGSIIVTVVAVLVILAVIIFCVYRRSHMMKQDKHIRMYRDETELASFTNEAFDSFSTQIDVDKDELPLHMPRKTATRDESSLHMPRKMATRWHNQSFMSKSSFTEDEFESEGL